jgi:hypothetical protein
MAAAIDVDSNLRAIAAHVHLLVVLRLIDVQKSFQIALLCLAQYADHATVLMSRVTKCDSGETKWPARPEGKLKMTSHYDQYAVLYSNHGYEFAALFARTEEGIAAAKQFAEHYSSATIRPAKQIGKQTDDLDGWLDVDYGNSAAFTKR